MSALLFVAGFFVALGGVLLLGIAASGDIQR